MEKYRRASVLAVWLYFLISTLVTFSEYGSITEGQNWYLGTKIILQIWLLALCVWVQTDPFGYSPNLWVGIHVICSNLQGQYFTPWYIFSYVEMIIAYSFLFPLPRKQFNIFITVGTLAFAAVSLYRYEEVHKWLYNSQQMDLIVAIVCASLVAWLCHNFFTADRNYREAMVRKFGIVGVQTATIVHDIKSMLAAPRLYTDLIKKKISVEDMELLALVDDLEKQLVNINRAMTGLNQVVSLQDQKKEAFQVRYIISEVAETLSLGNRKIALEVVGDLTLVSEKALMKSILFNIMMNSIHAFRKNKVSDPEIHVRCERDMITISDNGGGFPVDILEAMDKSRFQSFDGTGMGLFLVWNGVQSFGGKVHFSNIKDGAQVRIFVSNRSQSHGRRSLASFFKHH